MRTIGLDDRLEMTAKSGRFGRTCLLWKGQKQQLKKRGVNVITIAELKKAYYMCYITWIIPTKDTFSEQLYNISLENCTPIPCADKNSVSSYLRQVASMTAMSAVVSVEEPVQAQVIDFLKEEGFSFNILNDVPYTIYVDWATSPENTSARQLQKLATELLYTEAFHLKNEKLQK